MVSVTFFTCYIELGFLLLGLLFCFVEVLGFFCLFHGRFMFWKAHVGEGGCLAECRAIKGLT